jgi:hypothetical protein
MSTDAGATTTFLLLPGPEAGSSSVLPGDIARSEGSQNRGPYVPWKSEPVLADTGLSVTEGSGDRAGLQLAGKIGHRGNFC